MKKITIILFLVCSSLYGMCQSFGVTGATWHYNVVEAPMSGPERGYLKAESYKDTVILNKNCHVIKNTYYNSDESIKRTKNTYLFQDNFKIYQFIYNKFYVLYDFGVKKGDTIFVAKTFLNIGNRDTTFACRVDSVGLKVINGKSLKYYHTRTLDRSWIFDGNKIESLGDDQYMLPQNSLGFDSGYIGALRCYADKDLTYASGELCTKLIPSKEWAPIGATWYFNEPGASDIFGNKNTFVSFASKKDTIIKGRNCHVINVKLNDTKTVSNEYISQSKDSVFYYNPFYNSFFLLYNFSAKAGDTIVVHKSKFKPTKGFYAPYDSIANFKYKIIAIDTIVSGNNLIKRQKITSLHSGDWGFSSGNMNADQYIYQIAGSLTYFFGCFGNHHLEQIPTILRCYSDKSISYKSTDWNYPCDYLTGINEIENEFAIKVYPNPVINFVTIEAQEEMQSIQVVSALSNTIRKYYPDPKKTTIDFSLLSNGLYVLQITTKSKVLNYKILKN